MLLVVRLVTLEAIGGILDPAEYLPRILDWCQAWNDHLRGYFTLGNDSDPVFCAPVVVTRLLIVDCRLAFAPTKDSSASTIPLTNIAIPNSKTP